MSEERLCEAYGEHQAYCSMHGYPIGKSVEELLAEARATAVAPLEKRIRTLERHLAAYEMDSAPSPVREPARSEVDRLARQFHEMLKAFRYPGCGWQFASEVEDGSPLCPCPGAAAKYVARLAATPERPADEVGG